MFVHLRFGRLATAFLLVSLGWETPATAGDPASPYWFTGVGTLPDGDPDSVARVISGDGNVVAGFSGQPGLGSPSVAFRWRRDTGLERLNALTPAAADFGATLSLPRGLSFDGSIAMGLASSEYDGQSPIVEALQTVLWDAAGNITPLGTDRFQTPARNNPDFPSEAISDDGQFIAGILFGREESARWSEANGLETLGHLNNLGDRGTLASDISADGSVIVGSSLSDYDGQLTSTIRQAFIWTESNGIKGIGASPDGELRAIDATAVSADGLTVVGSGITSGGDSVSYRWTASDGFVSLGEFGVTSLSGDGSVVVGRRSSRVATIWTAPRGLLDVQEVLSEIGLANDIAGWELFVVTDISHDGRVITGEGRNPQGIVEGWVATIPEPAIVGIAALLLSCARTVRRFER